MRFALLIAFVCLAFVGGAETEKDTRSVADRTAAAMGHMFDGSPWNRMAADEVTW